jgi:hypothetical protein
MSSFAKTTVLSLTLLAGAAFAAHAQSGSVAALPPGTAAAPPAAASGAYPGPNPGAGYYLTEKCRPAVTPRPNMSAPPPGAGFYPAENRPKAQPSPNYVGPRPN